MLSSIRTRNKRTFVSGHFPSLHLLRQYLEAALEDERTGYNEKPVPFVLQGRVGQIRDSRSSGTISNV
jgi:hypothetical protein